MKFLILFLLSINAFADTLAFNSFDASVTGTSSQVLPWNGKRNYLLIQNKGTQSIIAKFGSVHIAQEGVLIISGGNYEPIKAPIDSLWIESVSGTQTVAIVEGKTE